MITKLDELAINGCNCFNCAKSHLFNDVLKCTKNCEEESQYETVDEYDIKECWTE